MIKKLLAITILGILLSCNAFAGWFDKDIIKVTKCWDPVKYKNYKQDRAEGIRQGMKKWEWELNLKEKIAYRIMNIDGQLQIDQFKIKISTKDYIIAHDPTGDVQFDLENEGYITSIAGINISLVCNFS